MRHDRSSAHAGRQADPRRRRIHESQSAMLGLATLLLCDCGAATAQFERGLRAYVDDDRPIEIVCPACAERERGEDESD